MAKASNLKVSLGCRQSQCCNMHQLTILILTLTINSIQASEKTGQSFQLEDKENGLLDHVVGEGSYVPNSRDAVPGECSKKPR